VTITVHNAGPEEPLEPTLFVDSGLSPASVPTGCTSGPPSPAFTCPLDTVPVGATRVFEFTFPLNAPTSEEEVRAWVLDAAEDTPYANDPDQLDNLDRLELATPTTSDMAVSVTPTHSTVRPGDTVDLTVTVSNAGPLDAVGHGVALDFNRNLRFDPFPFASCEKLPNETEFSCRFDRIEPGENVSGTVTIDFSGIDASAGTTIRWSAYIFHLTPYSELPEDLDDNLVSGTITLQPTASEPPAPGGGGSLPVTGVGVGPIVAAGGLAVALGAALILLARTFRRRQAPPA
jgi:Domain of unknown function DUF11